MVTGGDRDERLMGLMELALTIDPEERETYLRRACEDDNELFGEVTERLEWERKMQGFLLEPLVPRQETARPFQPRDVVNARYEIVREVDEGGMAVVYEAFDRTLEGRIAIKCPKPGFRRRLPPELRSAMKVSHPNVCRLHGIETAKAPSGEVEFLTMEFLSGQTLAARMVAGPVPDGEAREIARQVCEGLSEAHRQGVVHGDLKPSNIILTTDQGGGMRAVITDFGLAQPAGMTSGSLGTAQSDRLRGTPDFVAPELWKGARLSFASDIYALGVILYELASRKRPFDVKEGERRFTAAPTPPSKIIKGVSADWDRVTARCLDPDPAKRPASAAEVAKLLEPPAAALWKWLGAAAAVVAIGVAGMVWQRQSAPQIGPPLRVAVLDLASEPDAAALARGVMVDVAERLTNLGSRGNNLVIIPTKEVAASRSDTPEKAAKAVGATHVLAGTLRQVGANYRVQAQIWDAQVKHKLKDFDGEYTRAEIGSLPAALAGAVSSALKLRRAGDADTVSQAAYADYMHGIDLLRRTLDNADESMASLQKAVEKDPTSSLPYAALAEAQLLKFRNTRDGKWLELAKESAKKAQSHNPDSSEVLMLTGLVAASGGAYTEAIADYQRAGELNPANSEAFRRLGNVYEDMGMAVEAVRSYQKAAGLQPDYFKTYIDLGNHYFDQADLPMARANYEKAAQLAPEVRDCHYSLGRILLEMGVYEEAEKAFLAALRLHKEGTAFMGLGVIKTRQEKHHDAVGYFRQALEAGPESAFTLMNLGDAYRRVGDQQAAKTHFARAVELVNRELLENPKAVVPRALLGYLSARLGDKARAMQEIGQAIAAAPQNFVVRTRAILTYECLGNRAESLRLVESSSRTLLERLKRDSDLADLRSNPRFIELGSTRN